MSHLFFFVMIVCTIAGIVLCALDDNLNATLWASSSLIWVVNCYIMDNQSKRSS